MMPKPLAVVCSDVHFQHTAPVFRSDEPDWYAAMARTFDQVTVLANKLHVPVVIAGDIFDRWNAPVELVNFVAKLFFAVDRGVYAIPGQHDLPNHVYGHRMKSAYGTLALARAIVDIPVGVAVDFRSGDIDWMLYGFPWEQEIRPVDRVDTDYVSLAIVHAYVWKTGFGYPGASVETSVTERYQAIKPFTAVAFGDNHKGFMHGEHILNCGGLMRRKSDEIDYDPSVGILLSDGTFKRHFLSVENEVYTNTKPVQVDSREVDFGAYIKAMSNLNTASSLDFRQIVRQKLDAREIQEGQRKRLRVYLQEELGV